MTEALATGQKRLLEASAELATPGMYDGSFWQQSAGAGQVRHSSYGLRHHTDSLARPLSGSGRGFENSPSGLVPSLI